MFAAPAYFPETSTALLHNLPPKFSPGGFHLPDIEPGSLPMYEQIRRFYDLLICKGSLFHGIQLFFSALLPCLGIAEGIHIHMVRIMI